MQKITRKDFMTLDAFITRKFRGRRAWYLYGVADALADLPPREVPAKYHIDYSNGYDSNETHVFS